MAFPPENLEIWVNSRKYSRRIQTATYPPFTKGTFLLGFGPEVPDHVRRRRPKEILLALVEGEKMGFDPMCLYIYARLALI